MFYKFVILILYKYLWKCSSCLYCGRVYSSLVCAHCEQYLAERRAQSIPVCESCGIRLSSEISSCIQCREAPADLNILFVHSKWSYNIYTQSFLHEYKKQGNKIISYYLGKVMSELLTSTFDRSCEYVYVYLPPNPHHVRRLGFDYMKLYARSLSIQGEIRHVFPLYTRRESKEQKSLGKVDRKSNIQSSLRITESIARKMLKQFERPVRLVILDDVVTTRASVECARDLIDSHQLKSIVKSIEVVSIIQTEY